jgi:hypothetical protein
MFGSFVLQDLHVWLGGMLGGMLPAMAWPTVIAFCNVWLFVTSIAKKVLKQENHCKIAESLEC